MRSPAAAVAVFALLLALPVTARAAATADAAAAGPPQALAVQPATAGTLTPVRGVARTYELILHGVSPTLEAFDDSPGTGTQRITIAQLHAVLFGHPGAARKNAAISVGPRTMAVALLRGRYDRARRIARYRVRALRGARPLPRRLARPALFIDDFGGYSCHGNLNNSTALSLNPVDWEDPTVTQRMISDPGFAAPNTATDWESAGRFIATPCSVFVTFQSTDGRLGVQLAINENPMPNTGDESVECSLSGPDAYRYRCVQLWNRLSGMSRDVSWQLLPN
ncbi:hypothetical protein [Conexibacter woesei]|uniref:Uncharacterized protein n=1 Tax=Conexibacter woesei (strain DSM 14684 / CCUG 47730 / CIP 108061 / JCM 11494 / NBRC 100937 / ID131577) TaxID=469383 RepID=D3F1J4_CONWI|nr:hypothetical protein [Conexibacter woesei]ADB52157.1 hypothetical protein Cwoe_3740 [Conexibacter woesei DSM 14684]